MSPSPRVAIAAATRAALSGHGSAGRTRPGGVTAGSGVVLLGALVLAGSARGAESRIGAVAAAIGVIPVCVALLAPGAVRALRGGDGRSLLGAAALLLAAPLFALALLPLLGHLRQRRCSCSRRVHVRDAAGWP